MSSLHALVQCIYIRMTGVFEMHFLNIRIQRKAIGLHRGLSAY